MRRNRNRNFKILLYRLVRINCNSGSILVAVKSWEGNEEQKKNSSFLPCNCRGRESGRMKRRRRHNGEEERLKFVHSFSPFAESFGWKAERQHLCA